MATSRSDVPSRGYVDPERILATVCSSFGVLRSDLVGRSRARPCAEPRHVACFLMRRYTLLSLKNVARLVGRTDHTTVMYAVGQIEKRINDYPAAARMVSAVEDRLFNRPEERVTA